jgi:hypothetical protein
MAVAVFGTSESLVTVRGRSFRRYVYNHEWDAHVVCDGLRSGAMCGGEPQPPGPCLPSFSMLFDSTCAVLFVDGTEVCRGDCSCRS